MLRKHQRHRSLTRFGPYTPRRAAAASAIGQPNVDGGASAGAPRGRATIVVAEDDPGTMLLLRRVLHREGFRVVAVANGQLACDAVRSERPDVVLLDWNMPVMDGRAALQELKANRATRGIPIVMLTSHSAVDDRIVALESGVQDFLSKPFDPRELIACIEQQLRWRERLAVDADFAFVAERDALRAAGERRYRLLAEAMPLIVWIADARGRIAYFNHAWFAYAGESARTAPADAWRDAVHPDERAAVLAQWQTALREGSGYEVECRLRRADGAYRWHVARALPTRDERGAISDWIASCSDIHDYRIANETRAILDTMSSMVSIRTADGFVDYAGPQWTAYTGAPAATALGFGWRAFVHPDDPVPGQSSEPDRADEQCEYRLRRADGSYRWFLVQSRTLPASAGAPHRRLDIATDIDDLKRTQSALANTAARLEHLAHHDPMTNLPNRTLLGDRLAAAISLAQRSKTQVMVLYVDLDRFKIINDTRGHAAGDRVLAITSTRISDALRAGDTASRVGGDEFVLVCAATEATGDAARLANRLLEAIRQPIDLAGGPVSIGASIGISMYPADGCTGDELIRKADSAMYAAKQGGRNLFRVYAADAHTSIVAALDFEAEIVRGIAEGQIVVHYQPVIDARTNRLIGAEALVRWQHPQRGLLHPADFLSFAETHRLIGDIGAIVLDAVCREIARLPIASDADFRISMNVFSGQLMQPGWVAGVARRLAEHGAEPRRLQIEIAESIVTSEPAAVIAVLAELHALGIALSIDDFGTGLGSLAAIRAFPLHTLKIDRSFVHEIVTSSGDQAVAKTIIMLAHSLGLNVVAAGVETAAQIAALRNFGSDAFQGYLLSRPLPADELHRFLAGRETLELPVA